MVDCRPAATTPHDLPHAPPPENNHHAPNNQAGGSGDMGSHGITSPASARASTPATTNAITTYSGPMNPGVNMGGVSNMGVGVGVPYVCKPGGVVWVPPPLPPPPHHVNPHVYKSVQANGADLPMNDIPTLRYYFNLGVDCMWAAYGPPPPPPRHYSPRDIAQDMQQMSLHERGNNHSVDMSHKHKPQQADKQMAGAKGGGPRSLLGPRFNKRQDGPAAHPQGKGHNNNNMANKGPNNRRGVSESRSYNEGECVVEGPMLTLPYIPYPPPVYPIQYYPVDSDPSMMGMMAGMGYMGYEEGVEYGGMQPYYPPHYPPPHAMPPHLDHK